MTNFIKKERDKGIDIARGLAIILVVVGHSGINQYFWNFIFFICHCSFLYLDVFSDLYKNLIY